jgi:D-sedoheptulose 7-phosphate isomerase
MIADYAKEYITELKKSIDMLQLDVLEEIVGLIKKAYLGGRHIYVMGNGGSAATASHFVCDLVKGCSIKGKEKIKAFCLSDNIPLLTAWANDSSYDDIFSAQLEAYLKKEDLVIVFSGSGNSRNIVRAIAYANSIGALTVAFTGFEGGAIKDLAKKTMIVSSNNMERIEDTHLIIEHIIHLYLLDEINKGVL